MGRGLGVREGAHLADRGSEGWGWWQRGVGRGLGVREGAHLTDRGSEGWGWRIRGGEGVRGTGGGSLD